MLEQVDVDAGTRGLELEHVNWMLEQVHWVLGQVDWVLKQVDVGAGGWNLATLLPMAYVSK